MLKEVTIPASVSKIGFGVFQDCGALEKVTLLGDTPPEIERHVFGAPAIDDISGMSEPATYCKFVTDNAKGIHVPEGKAETYKTALDKGWEEWKDYIADDTEMTDAEKVAAAKPVVENALANFNATNDTAQEEILNVINTALVNAGITGVTVEIDQFVKQEATASAAGSITGVVFIKCGQESETVHMEKAIVQLTAEKYTVTVNGGTGGGEYETGVTVTITANVAPSGKQFDKWTVNSGSVTLADAASTTTTFTMPAEAVSVMATYKDIAGTITPEVKPGENAPGTSISTPAADLEDMLLTDAEKQQVQSGTDIKIILEVQDAGNTVSDADKESVRQALNGFNVGQYLNIDLYKLIGENRTDITETPKKIRIVITVPEGLKNADSSKTRTFAVIRVHDGQAEPLPDLDSSPDTITIETDRFSTYTVAYQDKANGGEDNNTGDNNGGSNGNDGQNSNNGNGGSENNADNNGTKPNSSKDREPKTGDSTPVELYATLAMIAGFAYLLLYFTDSERGMTEARKQELVARLVAWAKRGGRIRRCLGLAAIFVLLVYYHSTKKLHRGSGRETCAELEGIL